MRRGEVGIAQFLARVIRHRRPEVAVLVLAHVVHVHLETAAGCVRFDNRVIHILRLVDIHRAARIRKVVVPSGGLLHLLDVAVRSNHPAVEVGAVGLLVARVCPVVAEARVAQLVADIQLQNGVFAQRFQHARIAPSVREGADVEAAECFVLRPRGFIGFKVGDDSGLIADVAVENRAVRHQHRRKEVLLIAVHFDVQQVNGQVIAHRRCGRNRAGNALRFANVELRLRAVGEPRARRFLHLDDEAVNVCVRAVAVGEPSLIIALDCQRGMAAGRRRARRAPILIAHRVVIQPRPAIACAIRVAARPRRAAVCAHDGRMQHGIFLRIVNHDEVSAHRRRVLRRLRPRYIAAAERVDAGSAAHRDDFLNAVVNLRQRLVDIRHIKPARNEIIPMPAHEGVLLAVFGDGDAFVSVQPDDFALVVAAEFGQFKRGRIAN